jgi:hypothetical protein
MDSTSADPTDGHFFRYTHSVNSGKWQCVTRVNNAETVTNTNSTVPTLTNAEPLNVYRIDVNSDGTEVVFSIDGTTVAAHNKISGFSGVNRLTGIAYSIIKSAGTTARQFVIDYTYCVCTLGSQR